MKLPQGLTTEIVLDAAKREMFGTDNPGFCLDCGMEHDGCEPDARGYPCESCGENKVMGAQEIMLHLVA